MIWVQNIFDSRLFGSEKTPTPFRPFRPTLSMTTVCILTAVLATGFANAVLTTELVASGLNEPTFLTSPLGDESRLFVLERNGVIKIIRTSDYALLSTPFLDISHLVNIEGTRAANGFAFHPEYATNGYFFIQYNDLQGEVILARYQVSASDSNVANPASGTIFLFQSQNGLPHNGGNPVFRPGDANHYLYLPLGDGAASGDYDPAQDNTSPLGAMLRIDVDRGPGPDVLSPFAPDDNPFVDGAGPNADTIWFFGLRNPWRVSFDRETGDLFFGDAGGIFREEINFHPASSPGGENYGWRLLEGTHPALCTDCDEARATTTLPIFEYPHTDIVKVVIGGYVYRGADIPYLQGQYVFGDLFGTITSFIFDPFRPTEPGVNPGNFTDRTLNLNPALNQFVSFGEDARAELYIIGRSGSIFKIIDPDRSPCPDGAEIQAQFLSLAERFSPDSDDFDGDALPDAAALALFEFAACLNEEFNPLWTAVIDSYNTNLATLDAEPAPGDLPMYAGAVAAFMALGGASQDALAALFAADGINLSSQYTIVGCPPLAECVATLPGAPGLAEPFSGAGDLDGDGSTNAQEFANVMAQGGDLEAFVAAAFDAKTDGSPEPDFDNCVLSLVLMRTPFSGNLDAIRSFRDNFMLKNPAGIAAADLYYRISHMIAPRLAGSALLHIQWAVNLRMLLAIALLFILAYSLYTRIRLQGIHNPEP